MAKLNNKGWGISNLITFLVIFLLFLLLIVYLVYRVDHEKDSNIQLVEEDYILIDNELQFLK